MAHAAERPQTRARHRVRAVGAAFVLLAAAVVSSASSCHGAPGVGQSAANDYTLILGERAGPYRYGQVLSGGNAYRHAVAAFGRPTSRGRDTPESNVCTVRWEDIGIDIGFAWSRGPCRARNLDRAAWAGMRLFGNRWRTAKGLRIGDPVRRITRLYPRAKYVSRPPRPGEWWLLVERHSELGAHPLLVAEVGAGRVIALRVPPGRI